MSERLRQVSLRKFRTEIADIHEVVEVSRRDPDGNIQILGYWTPYPIQATIVAPAVLEIPPGDDPEDPEDQAWLAAHSVPHVIKTPEQAAVAVRTDPVRAVPKPSQKAAKR